MTRMLRVLARRHGWWAGSWVVVVGALVALGAPAYTETYATAEARRLAVAREQDDAASLLLYGRLPDPGTPAQMFAWEIGAFVTLIVAVVGLLLAVRLTRAAEEDGTVELLRSCGAGRSDPLRAALLLLGLVAVALGVVAGGAVALQAGAVPGADAEGCLTFGAVVAVTFVLVASAGCLLAQLLPTARAVRVVGGLGLGVAFLLRGAADVLDVAPLGWGSPLGLRGSVAPYTDDDLVPLVVAGGATALLVGATMWSDARRELGAARWSARAGDAGSLHVHTTTGLAARLGWRVALVWLLSVTAGSALFAMIGSGVVDSVREGSLDNGFLGTQLDGADPAVAYLRYTGIVVGIVVAAAALLLTLQAAGEERAGLSEQLRAAGARPSGPLAGAAALAVVASGLTLSGAAAATAVVAEVALGDGLADDAFWQVAGQWPAVLALQGVAVLLAGTAPRVAWLAWVPYALSVGLVLLGEFLGVPDIVVDLAAFGHLPVTDWTARGLVPSVLLLAAGGLATAGGLAGVRRRDLVVG